VKPFREVLESSKYSWTITKGGNGMDSIKLVRVLPAKTGGDLRVEYQKELDPNRPAETQIEPMKLEFAEMVKSAREMLAVAPAPKNETPAGAGGSSESKAKPACEICGTEKNWKGPGVSKKTGKPYNGFWSCPNWKQHPAEGGV